MGLFGNKKHVSEKKIHNTQCVCVGCGQTLNPADICFDLSGAISIPGLSEADQTICQNLWKNTGGPSDFSEKELLKYIDLIKQNADVDVVDGILSISGDEWRSRVEGYYHMLRRKSVRKQEEENVLDILQRCFNDTENADIPPASPAPSTFPGAVPGPYPGAVPPTITSSNHSTSESTPLEDSNKWSGLQILLKLDMPKNVGIRIGKLNYRAKNNDWVLAARRCPSCAHEMSFWSGRYPEICLAVLGGPRISKTTSLAACAYMFTTGRAQCGVSWEGHEDDKDWRIFRENYIDRYAANEKVAATTIGEGDNDSRPRFSVRLVINRPAGRKIYRVLTFLDLPGELMNANGINTQLLDTYPDYFKAADCIFYCTDAAEVQSLELGEGDGNDLRDLHGRDIGTDVIQTHRWISNMRDIRNYLPKQTPVILQVGKSDLFSEDAHGKAIYDSVLYNSDYLLHINLHTEHRRWLKVRGGNHPYAVFLARDFQLHAKKLCNTLQNINGAMIDAFKNEFPIHAVIATSNYGHGFRNRIPEKDELQPFQTELPFLWFLATQGLILTADDAKSPNEYEANIGAENKSPENKLFKTLTSEIYYRLN